MAQYEIIGWSKDWESEVGMTVREFAVRAGLTVHPWQKDETLCAWNRREEDAAWALFTKLRDSRKAAPAPTAAARVSAEPLATPKQIDYIMRLIRAGAAEEGGYLSVPTTREGVARLPRSIASACIDSLKGNY